MTTEATTSAVTSGLPDAAARAAQRLRHVVADHGLMHGDQAQAMLCLSRDGLTALMRSGDLAGVLVDGEVWVSTAHVQAHVLAAAAAGARRSMELVDLARTVLSAHLHDVVAVGDWDTARAQGRPLVCARRGRNHVRHGLRFHSVVLSVTELARWAHAHAEQRPELGTCPVGPTLAEALCALPGIDTATSATPLIGGGAHRLKRWVSVDAAYWPVRVTEQVDRLVSGPGGAR